MAPEKVLQQLLDGYSQDQAQRKSMRLSKYEQVDEIVDRLRKLQSSESAGIDDNESFKTDKTGATILTKTRPGEVGPIVQVILPLASVPQSIEPLFSNQNQYQPKKSRNQMFNSNNAYLQLHSTPDSSVLEPSSMGRGSSKSVNVISNSSEIVTTSSAMLNHTDKMTDKKINFAYHPIFDYILN